MNRHISQEIDLLLETVQSVQLATLNPQKQPEISYTPYLKIQDLYYIFISELAAHTQNLRKNPLVSLMFIEDEACCKNIFARKRLILECEALQIERTDSQWETTMQAFAQVRGNTISLLKSLPDFYLFQLSPKKGSFIKGFGDAYALSGNGLKHVEQL